MPTFTRTTPDGDREYIDPADRTKVYPSVTSILGVLSKPALIPWAAKMTAECAADNAHEIARLVDAGQRAAVVRRLKHARFADSRMDTGSALHARVEAYLLGSTAPRLPDGVDSDQIDAMLTQYRQWETDFEPVYELVETRLCNPMLGYAGRLDLLSKFPRLGGVTLAIDIKTGANVYPETALQLAAYRNATEVWLDSGEKVPMPRVDGGAVLHLRPDAYSFIPVDTDTVVFGAFLASLSAYIFRRDSEPTVLGAPYRPGWDHEPEPWQEPWEEPQWRLGPAQQQRRPADEPADQPPPEVAAITHELDRLETQLADRQLDSPPEPAPAEPKRKPRHAKAAGSSVPIAEIRAWGVERGMAKPTAGRLPLKLVQAWNHHHPDRPYATASTREE
jgi:hypothetical protein